MNKCYSCSMAVLYYKTFLKISTNSYNKIKKNWSSDEIAFIIFTKRQNEQKIRKRK